jgi:hypothetical protein
MPSFLPTTLVDWAQIASAIGTCGAVIISLFLSNRGVQTKVKATCEVVQGLYAPSIRVTVRNVGRDPVYLVMLSGEAADGSERSERFLPGHAHLILPPSAPNTVVVEKHMTVTQPEQGLPKPWARMWIVDVSGKRFPISGSTDCLAAIWPELSA